MSQGEAPGRGSESGGTDASLSPESDADLLRRAERALRAALRAGLGGDADTQRLQDWTAQRRVQRRRDSARSAVEQTLAAIRAGGGMV